MGYSCMTFKCHRLIGSPSYLRSDIDIFAIFDAKSMKMKTFASVLNNTFASIKFTFGRYAVGNKCNFEQYQLLGNNCLYCIYLGKATVFGDTFPIITIAFNNTR